MPPHVFTWLQEKTLALLARAGSARQEITVALIFLLALLVTGTAGYVVIEGWPWMDGLYMTFITLTTIGFTEVNALSNAGRLFTMLIGTLGIGAAAFIATRSVQLLITNRNFRERRIARLIKRMDHHFIVCGYGRIGRRIAQDLEHNGKPFVVVELNEERVEKLPDTGHPYVQGDARDEDILRQAGVEHAEGLIVTLPEDSANVFVTLTAREVTRENNPGLLIMARASDHGNLSKLRTAGADRVVAPIEVGADRMAQVVVHPHVDRFMEEVLRTGALGLQMEEVRVQKNAPLAGKSLAESNFRQQFDAIVTAVINAETDDMVFNPSPHAEIKAGSILVVLGNQEMIERLRREGCTPS